MFIVFNYSAVSNKKHFPEIYRNMYTITIEKMFSVKQEKGSLSDGQVENNNSHMSSIVSFIMESKAAFLVLNQRDFQALLRFHAK